MSMIWLSVTWRPSFPCPAPWHGRAAPPDSRHATAFDAMPGGHARGMSRRRAASWSGVKFPVRKRGRSGSAPFRAQRSWSGPPVPDKIVKRREGLGGEGRGSCRHVHVGVRVICFADRGDAASSGPRLPGCPGKPAAGSADDPVSRGTTRESDPVMTVSGAGATSWAGAPSARGDGFRGWTGQGRAFPPWPLR